MPSHDGTSATSILDEYEKVTQSIAVKADKNKSRARRATLMLAGSTVLIPVSIVLSSEYFSFFFGKALPSILAAVSALTAAWTQIERPHERWSLYRRYHRLLEADRLRYERGAPPFGGDDRELAFADNLAQRQLDLHDELGRVTS